jgi:hypothetical protein
MWKAFIAEAVVTAMVGQDGVRCIQGGSLARLPARLK